MYRVLIVDDENLIVDSLHEYIYSRRSEEYDIVKACSAGAAYGILQRMRIDIVITDIQMPGIDGIQLHESIRNYWSACRTIFLTAHDKFEYAYYANKNENTWFILKSEGFESVLRLLDEVAKDITRSLIRQKMLENSGLSAGEDKESELLKTTFLMNLITNSSRIGDRLQDEFNRLGFSFDASLPFYAVLIKLGNHSDGCGEEKIGNVVSYVRSCFADRFHLCFLRLDRTGLMVFFQSISGNQPDAKYIDGIFELIHEPLEKITNESIGIVLSGNALPWDEACPCYRSMIKCLEYHKGFGDLIICSVNEEERRKEKLMYCIEQVLLCPKDDAPFAIKESMERMMQILSEADDCVEKNRYLQKALYAAALNADIQRLHQFKQLANELEHCEAVSAEKVCSILCDLYQNSGEDRHQNNILSLTLERIDQYMEEHYAEDISLADIAGYVYLSASYVSRIYKKMCGINIIERLQQIRIRKSRELLSETNIKVQDVALSVGFNSPRYFCSVFKKNTGYTPQEYREKYTVLQ